MVEIKIAETNNEIDKTITLKNLKEKTSHSEYPYTKAGYDNIETYYYVLSLVTNQMSCNQTVCYSEFFNHLST